MLIGSHRYITLLLLSAGKQKMNLPVDGHPRLEPCIDTPFLFLLFARVRRRACE